MINYITGKSNERADALSRREQDVPEAGDDRLEYRMAQLLKPGMLNFEPRANERPELDQSETRNPIEIQPVGTGESGAESQPISTEEPESELENLWATTKSNDEVYQSMVKTIKKGKRTLPTSLALKVFIGDCSLDNNETLFFKGRKWVPESEPLRTQLIQRIHDSLLTSHPGREVTAALMSRSYFWPGMLLDIRPFVRDCDVCGRNKARRDRKQGFLKPLLIPSRIWSEISIDFVIDLPESEGCKNLLVITDRLRKGVILEPCDSMDAEAMSEIFIRKFYRQHGLPAIIIFDRGRQFVSILWKRICKILGISRRLSTIYHPQIDGATERMNQTVETFLRIYIDFDQRNWAKLLLKTEFVINNKDAASTGVNPFFLSHGYHAKILETDEKLHATGNEIRNPIQKTDNILTKLKQTNDWAQTTMAVAQQNQHQYADRTRAQAFKYKVKDKIWLTLKDITTTIENKKLDAKQTKYTILEDMGFHNFRLDTPPGIRNIFHVDKLQLQRTLFLPRYQIITIQAQRSSVTKTGPTSTTSKRS